MGQQEYQAGANMAFKAFGISDQMQQRQMMQQLQQQQMGQQALQMQLIQAQIRAAEDNTKRLAATDLKAEEYQKEMGKIFNPKQTADIETGNIQPVYPTMNQDMMSRAMGLTAQHAPPGQAMGAFGDIYKGMQTQPKMQPVGAGGLYDPTTQQVIPPFQESKEPSQLTEASILALPPTDPRQINYLKAKSQLQAKEPYFQAVGIIEATNELIGFDTRTFKTKRVPISGMPIKPGTVKSTNPVQQFIADALKETGKYKMEEEGKPSASENKGKILRDTTTGKRERSDGVDWIPIP